MTFKGKNEKKHFKLNQKNENDQWHKREETVPIVYVPEEDDKKRKPDTTTVICKKNKDDEGNKKKIPILNDGTDESYLKVIMKLSKNLKNHEHMLSEDKIENKIKMLQECFEGATYNNYCRQFKDIEEDLNNELLWEKFWELVE